MVNKCLLANYQAIINNKDLVQDLTNVVDSVSLSVERVCIFFIIEIKPLLCSNDPYPSTDIESLFSEIMEIFPSPIISYNIENKYFCIISYNIKNLDEQASKICKFINLYTPKKRVYFDVSIGMIEINENLKDVKEIIYNAYNALNNVRNDKRYLSYNELLKIDEITDANINSILLLKDRIQNDKVLFAYQPIIEVSSWKASHYECLLRIYDNEKKLSSAGPYIALAEEMHFIDILDEKVLEMISHELENSLDIEFSFNVSSKAIDNIDWQKRAEEIFSNEFLANRVIIEITETSLQKNMDRSIKFIKKFQDLGCKIAIDDFGSGYTSFEQLKKLPVNIIKIDKLFIDDIIENDVSKRFVKMIIDMGHMMGAKLVAEYVDTKEKSDLLTKMNVDYMQGYYFSPPSFSKIFIPIRA